MSTLNINPDVFDLFESKMEAALKDLLLLLDDGEEFPNAVYHTQRIRK